MQSETEICFLKQKYALCIVLAFNRETEIFFSVSSLHSIMKQKKCSFVSFLHSIVKQKKCSFVSFLHSIVKQKKCSFVSFLHSMLKQKYAFFPHSWIQC